MATRTTETTITFRRPFSLTAVDSPQPAGTYRLVTDEEEIIGLSFLALRRTATMLYTPAVSTSSNSGVQVFLVDPAELKDALEADGRTKHNDYCSKGALTPVFYGLPVAMRFRTSLEENPMTRRDGYPASVGLRSEMAAEARQQMATRKLRALMQTDKDKDPEIRRLLKTLSAYDVAKQLGLL